MELQWILYVQFRRGCAHRDQGPHKWIAVEVAAPVDDCAHPVEHAALQGARAEVPFRGDGVHTGGRDVS